VYLVSDKYKYVLQTWEKSGCTTLRNLFLKLHYDELTDKEKKFVDKNEINNTDRPNGPCDSNQFNHIHREMFPTYIPDAKKDGYFLFGVVRNSYERVVSMYFNRWLNINPNNPTDIAKRSTPWDKYGCSDAFTFNEFVTFLCGAIKYLDELKKESLPIWACEFYEVGGRKLIFPGDDKHMRSQWDPVLLQNYWDGKSKNKLETYIHLDKLGDELPKLYEEKIGISASKIRKILSDRKMSLKRGNFENEGKLDNYDFLMDPMGYNILENGIPPAKNMITEYNVKLISLWYEEEISYHNFGHQHLL
jgi:hypothetical protein